MKTQNIDQVNIILTWIDLRKVSKAATLQMEAATKAISLPS